VQEGHAQQSTNIPIIRADPDNRCAAMLVYGQQLVVLPFRREIMVDSLDGTAAGARSVTHYYTCNGFTYLVWMPVAELITFFLKN
jgi:hypothetical protein